MPKGCKIRPEPELTDLSFSMEVIFEISDIIIIEKMLEV
jgi:hypothetical protein